MAAAEVDWPAWSSDCFLVPFRDWYFPGREIAVVECDGVRVRTVLLGSSRAVSAFWHFAFYLEPVASDSCAGRVPFLADVAMSKTLVGLPGPPGALACPYVDWRGFTSFEDYLQGRLPLPGQDSPATILAKLRRLERHLGPVSFAAGIDRPEVFDRLLDLKAQQYRRTAGNDRLELPHNRAFYHELRRRGVMTASTIEAGGRLVAGKLGMRIGGRYLARLTVYDPAVRRFSPGAILEMEALRASFEARDSEFDFLMGDQRYKFTWATHVRWLQDVGKEPVLDRFGRTARWRAASAVRGKPGAVAVREVVRRVSTLPRRKWS